MKFRNVAVMLLGDRGKPKVLRYLLTGGPAASEREIARLLGMSHVAVNKIMKDFESAGLVSASRVGGSKIWFVKEKSFAREKLAGLAALANPYADLKKMIAGKLEKWKESIEFAVIYGSVGERREEEGSDIDLLIVLKKETYNKKSTVRIGSDIMEEMVTLSTETLIRYGNTLQPIVVASRVQRETEFAEIIEKARNGIYVMP